LSEYMYNKKVLKVRRETDGSVERYIDTSYKAHAFFTDFEQL